MFRRRAAAVLLLGALQVAAVGSGQDVAGFAVWTPSSAIERAEETAREEIAGAMQQAAASLGLTLDASDLVYLSCGDLVLVVAGAEGFGETGSAIRPTVTDVGVIYTSRDANIRFGDGEHGRLPSGFHAIRVEADAGERVHDPGITILEISTGSEDVLAIPVALLAPGAERAFALTLEPGEAGAETEASITWCGELFGVELRLVFELTD
jgi:hypothetical protein